MSGLVLNSELMGDFLCTDVCKVVRTLDYKEIKSALTFCLQAVKNVRFSLALHRLLSIYQACLHACLY